LKLSTYPISCWFVNPGESFDFSSYRDEWKIVAAPSFILAKPLKEIEKELWDSNSRLLQKRMQTTINLYFIFISNKQ
jgi:hypothetical protein